MTDTTAHETRREIAGLTARAERKALNWLAARMPACIGSDPLTALGLLAMAAAGLAYAASRHRPCLLHVVNLCLLVNWFGDSLDGTLARFRRRSRPRYGYYVDHMVDSFGVLMVLGGLALSNHMGAAVAVTLLVLYYLLSIHIYLATHSLGIFKISFGPVGGTELRILLALANMALLFKPRVAVLGTSLPLFDLVGGLAIAGLLVTLAAAVASTTARLYRLEPVPRTGACEHPVSGREVSR